MIENCITLEQLIDDNFNDEEKRLLKIRSDIRIASRYIKEKRLELGYTQEILSKKANIPRTTISKIESGYQNVSILKLMQLADAMDMKIEIALVEKD